MNRHSLYVILTCHGARAASQAGFHHRYLLIFFTAFLVKKSFHILRCILLFAFYLSNNLVIRVQSVKHYWRAVFRKVFVIAEILIVCSFIPKRDMDDWKLQARTVVRLEIKRNMFVSFLC